MFFPSMRGWETFLLFVVNLFEVSTQGIFAIVLAHKDTQHYSLPLFPTRTFLYLFQASLSSLYPLYISSWVLLCAQQNLRDLCIRFKTFIYIFCIAIWTMFIIFITHSQINVGSLGFCSNTYKTFGTYFYFDTPKSFLKNCFPAINVLFYYLLVNPSHSYFHTTFL